MLSTQLFGVLMKGGAHSFCLPVSLIDLADPCDDERLPLAPGSARIVLVWGGSGQLRMGVQGYEPTRGFAMVARTTGPLIVARPGTLRGVVIEYMRFGQDGMSAAAGGLPDGCLKRCSAGILRLGAELLAAWQEPDSTEPYQVQLLFSRLLIELRREMERQYGQATGWLQELTAFIREHYGEEMSREQLAADAGVSPEHFSRAFRKYTGKTFNEYLTLYRIRGAQRRLLTEPADLNTIADKVGYKEGLYFSRKFKSVVGMSPTVYRRQRKRVVALNWNHTATLLALDSMPELGVYMPWIKRRYAPVGASLNPFAHTAESLYEAVADVRPDVIIHYGEASENASLVPLAPVIGLSFRSMSWREQFRAVAEAVNKSRQAEGWLARYEAQIGQIRMAMDKRHGRRGTAIVWELAGELAFGCGECFGRAAHILYGDLGFRPPAGLRERLARGYVEARIEAIPEYAADYVFITGMPASPHARRRLRRLFRSETWLAMEAVRNGRAYMLTDTEVCYGFDPLSTQEQLKMLTDCLLPGHNFE
ncbi:AraC family transcriptional regulator [Cohnella hashimotonis]|uniref:AraC family transcriptional regulator n=1 Tax=Cohnella hashimotonis TaxID=2826895 RepID=A0ABT6TDN8_9BACL|nr:AraC family transcriptional regulator [Cohnella hashimotonis]MDI4643977.1 AraC family transcriptional regulator [Cohnella hashimotonis]